LAIFFDQTHFSQTSKNTRGQIKVSIGHFCPKNCPQNLGIFIVIFQDFSIFFVIFPLYKRPIKRQKYQNKPIGNPK
jgi:hypothetical protein